MKVWMTTSEADNLSEFLNRVYQARWNTHKRQGRVYSMTNFANDLGIGQSTLSRLMKLGPHKKPVEGIDTPILIALYDEFGKDVIDALRVDAGDVVKKREKG